jgi:glutaredoxin
MFVELLEKHQGQFLVFTGKFCGFCTAAKRFLDGKKIVLH